MPFDFAGRYAPILWRYPAKSNGAAGVDGDAPALAAMQRRSCRSSSPAAVPMYMPGSCHIEMCPSRSCRCGNRKLKCLRVMRCAACRFRTHVPNTGRYRRFQERLVPWTLGQHPRSFVSWWYQVSGHSVNKPNDPITSGMLVRSNGELRPNRCRCWNGGQRPRQNLMKRPIKLPSRPVRLGLGGE